MSSESLGEPSAQSDPCDGELKDAVEAVFGEGAFDLISQEGGAAEDSVREPLTPPPTHGSPDRGGGDYRSPSPVTGERHVLFAIAKTQIAVPLCHVLEIHRVPLIASVPHAPQWLRGMANLRGSIISVVDLGQFMGMGPSQLGRRMLVVRSSTDNIIVGLIVDRVLGLCRLASDAVTEVQPLADDTGGFIRGQAEADGMAIAILDLDKLLLSTKFRLLTTELERTR